MLVSEWHFQPLNVIRVKGLKKWSIPYKFQNQSGLIHGKLGGELVKEDPNIFCCNFKVSIYVYLIVYQTKR